MHASKKRLELKSDINNEIKMNLLKYFGCCAYKIVNNVGRDLVLLLIRISMIYIFFKSGVAKINDWESTLFLFELEYAVPIIPYELAAYFATFFELTMPFLILIGFCTRLSAVPLLMMTFVIQFVLGAANPAYDHLSHYHWMLLLSVLICFGGGRISLDWLFCKIFCKKKCKTDSKADSKLPQFDSEESSKP